MSTSHRKPSHHRPDQKLPIDQAVLYKGHPTHIISFVPSSGKYVLAGIGPAVSPTDFTVIPKKPA